MPVTTAKKAAAKKAAPAQAAVQATITLKHLAAALADSHDIAKKQAEAVLGDMVTLTTRHLKRRNQDQGQQEGRVPACQGTEGSRLLASGGLVPSGHLPADRRGRTAQPIARHPAPRSDLAPWVTEAR